MTRKQTSRKTGAEHEERCPQRWPALACGAAAAIGVAWAAAYVSVQGVERDVGIAAWVAVAVVGASATISAAQTFQLPLRRVPRVKDDEEPANGNE